MEQAEELRQYKKAISIHLKALFEYVRSPDEISIERLVPIEDLDDYFEEDEMEKTELGRVMQQYK